MLAVLPGRCHSVAVNPFAFLVIFLAGGMNRNPQEVIEYSPEEVGVLKELMGNGTIKGCIIKSSSRSFRSFPPTGRAAVANGWQIAQLRLPRSCLTSECEFWDTTGTP